MKVYEGTQDKLVQVTLKIDGVKAIFDGFSWVSRAGKRLFNLPLDIIPGSYEVFLGNFKDSISRVKTHNGIEISHFDLYMLAPAIDYRLCLGFYAPKEIPRLFKKALKDGYEGLVIYTSEGEFKLKRKITLDVEIIGIYEGKGKYEGYLGGFDVELPHKNVRFKVGSGFTDKIRKSFRIDGNVFISGKIPSEIMEISGMEILPSGKLRHPVFERFREDLK